MTGISTTGTNYSTLTFQEKASRKSGGSQTNGGEMQSLFEVFVF